MDSMLGNLPSINPQNFSQLRPSDPSNSSSIPLSTESEELEVGIESTEAVGAFMPRKPSTVGSHFVGNINKKTPVTYRPTHDRTIPPPDQVINSDEKNILLRHFYQRAEEKLRPKRAASENLSPEHANKHPRASSLDSSL